MERRNSRERNDEEVLAKAAAWAWYQRGSGSEGKPMHEFNVTRSDRAPKPSRYQLEAMKIIQEKAKKSQTSDCSSPTGPWSPSSTIYTEKSLLDTYEIERISQQLDYLIKTSKANFYSGLVVTGDCDHRKIAAWPEDDHRIHDTGKKKKEKNRTKGVWQWKTRICGSIEDVVVGLPTLQIHRRPR